MPAQAGPPDPADLHPASLFTDKVFGVFVAEPVSDIIAATVTATMLFTRLNKILDWKQ